MAFVLKNYKFGTGGLGAEGGVVKFSFATSNFAQPGEWSGWNGLPFTYTSFLTEQFKIEVREALKAWEAAADIKFVEVPDGQASLFRFGFVNNFDDAAGGPGGKAGEARVSFSDNAAVPHVGDADVAFDARENWVMGPDGKLVSGAGGTQFYAIALHEIGHALGIDHNKTDGERSIMKEMLDPSYKGLEAVDIQAAQAIYGKPAAQPDADMFLAPKKVVDGFGKNAGGWANDDQFHREMADVNGDGKADIVGFGGKGVYVALAIGDGQFAEKKLAIEAFARDAGAWNSNDELPRMLADVNGDGKDDIVGFGRKGVYVSLATGNGNFADPKLELQAFGRDAGGWTSDDKFHREMADVNGDGMADIVGFGSKGVYVALATGGGHFADRKLELSSFGSDDGWTSNDEFPRTLADVNGDGMDDIVGFGRKGVYVSLATGGGDFAAPKLELQSFGRDAGGWASNDSVHREVADVNGDGMADIIGFGAKGAYVALATGDGHFAEKSLELAAFGKEQGWTNDGITPREVADVNGDGRADIVGFGSNGVQVALANELFMI